MNITNDDGTRFALLALAGIIAGLVVPILGILGVLKPEWGFLACLLAMVLVIAGVWGQPSSNP